MRKIELIGTICKKPEMRTTQTGKDVCSFDIAVYVNSEKSDFYRISAWGKQGESCYKWLDKGKKVYVRGDLSASIYEGKNGAKIILCSIHQFSRFYWKLNRTYENIRLIQLKSMD